MMDLNHCRICLRESDKLESIYEPKNMMLIADLITIIIPIQVKFNDQLSKKICEKCLNTLISAIQLRTTGAANDHKMRNQLKKSSTEQTESVVIIKQEPLSQCDPFQNEAKWESSLSEQEIVPRRRKKKNGFNIAVEKEKYLCKFCGKLLQTLKGKKDHEARHGKMSFYCDYCEKGFYTKEEITKHMFGRHVQGKADVSCDLCSRKFATFQQLANHRYGGAHRAVQKRKHKHKRKVTKSQKDDISI